MSHKLTPKNIPRIVFVLTINIGPRVVRLLHCNPVQGQYRASTGPEQGFPCVLFPHREKPVFITGFPGDGNRFFPVGKSTQGKPCFHYRDGFAVMKN